MPVKTKLRTLNLGCGTKKIDGAINVDMSDKVKPDMVFDIATTFPLESKSFDEVYFFHCIEHLEKVKHTFVLTQIHRVLRPFGLLYISYPEFKKICLNWINNVDCNRKFWEATIYGRQLYPGDYHFCAMDTLQFKQVLEDVGFMVVKEMQEPQDEFNTVLVVKRLERTISYEELLHKELFNGA